MSSNIIGPGSQPDSDDGAKLEYMEMPKGMRIYAAPLLPEPDEVTGIEVALDILNKVQAALETQKANTPTTTFDITHLDEANRYFVDQALGDGEVSVVAGATIQAQESVLAGIWRVHEIDITGAMKRDLIEVGSFPTSVIDVAHEAAFETMRPHRGQLPPGVLNATALITELDDKIAFFRPGQLAHVINLTLLPQSEEDLAFLDQRLGPGSVTVLSRGYGNCRITSTAKKNVWWVRYFNSRDSIVLNNIEVVDIPDVACAAQEDLLDSAQRLDQILGVYR